MADWDIGCPIPPAPESTVDGFDFFTAMLRLSRLTSLTYQTLFATSATLNSPQQYTAAIDSMRESLDKWKLSIPVKFRPTMPFQSPDTLTTFMLLRMHYMYHALIMAICRLEAHIGAGPENSKSRTEAAAKELVGTARTVLQLTTYIDVRSCLPSW